MRTASLSSLHLLRNVTSTEKIVVQVQSILYRLCNIGRCEIGHSGVIGIDRADQLVKEATGFDIDLPVSIPLSHFKHLVWFETASA